MALSDVDLTVNLYTEGDKFFDLLKAAVRDWQGGWGHERERAAYALELYQRGFLQYEYGVACALSVVMLILNVGFIALYMRSMHYEKA